jgi:hypothetical protein
MKPFLLSGFFLLISILNLTIAQTGKISGTIRDAATNEPLIGANVVVEGTSIGAATNVEGYYVILNVPPGSYSIRISMIGYTPSTITNVRVNIDQSTIIDHQLAEQTIETDEVVVIATAPIVQQDVSSSQINLNIEEIENLPVVSITSVINLQAGIQSSADGPIIRGGAANETAFMVNGLTLRDERNNTPYTGISFTSIEDIQIQTGGFNAEYGNIRSGVINAVTKEGYKDKYTFSLYSRYSPPNQKHFGPSPNDPNSYWIRPYLDPSVAWTGTDNGNWSEFLQDQYPEFDGWNAVSQQTLNDNNPNNDLSPQAAQQLFLWQHRKVLDIQQPDYSIDMTLAGPVPGGEALGGLRFAASFRKSRSYYVIPLSRDSYMDWSGHIKFTSNLNPDMKLSVEGLYGIEEGTNDNNAGDPGIFQSASSIADVLDRVSYINARIFATDYWAPTEITRNMFGGKFTHVLSPTTFYEVTVSRFSSEYNTNPGRLRDTTALFILGSGYRVDEAPFGYWPAPSTGINGIRMGVGFSNSRDSSRIIVYNARADFISQFDKYNQFKAGIELVYSDNNVNYASVDVFLPSGRSQSVWHTYPIRGSAYIQDKLEFEGMIANLGLRLDYSHAGGDWYLFSRYTRAFTADNQFGLDTLQSGETYLGVTKEETEKKLTLSPRLGVAFPISENSKIFFNYGHFRQLPDPNNLYLLRRFSDTRQVARIADPNLPLPLTVAYELGYEQNLFDQYLIRVAGYYKDVSQQPKLVSYTSRDSKVDYDISEATSYSDTRGFEIQISKNRGDWVQGFINYTYMVRSTGFFGFEQYYENAAENRNYQITSRDAYQEKPIPQPYARANIDFFTPREFGPEFGGFYLFEDWRLNLLASYSAGTYITWAGGGTIPGVQYNVQWKDFYNLDLRLSKTFHFGPLDLQFFMDISNALNIKYMSSGGYGFVDGQDYDAYMKSLHMNEEVFADFTKNPDGSINTTYFNAVRRDASGNLIDRLYVFGDDRPGDYRTGEYHEWDDNADDATKEQWRKNKSYIDMPNQDFLTFLNPRDIFFGLRASVAIF